MPRARRHDGTHSTVRRQQRSTRRKNRCGRHRRCSLNMYRRPHPHQMTRPPSGPSDGGTTQHYQQPPLLRPQQPPSTSSQPTSAPPQPPSSLAPSLHQRPACSASSSTWQQQTGQSQPPRAAQIDWERPQGISECVPTNKPTRPHRAGTRRADGPSDLPPSERSTAGSRVPPPDALSRSPANVNRRCACAAAASAAAAALNRRPQEAPAHGGEGSCSSCGGALLPSIPLEYHSQPAHRMYEPRQQQQAAPSTAAYSGGGGGSSLPIGGSMFGAPSEEEVALEQAARAAALESEQAAAEQEALEHAALQSEAIALLEEARRATLEAAPAPAPSPAIPPSSEPPSVMHARARAPAPTRGFEERDTLETAARASARAAARSGGCAAARLRPQARAAALGAAAATAGHVARDGASRCIVSLLCAAGCLPSRRATSAAADWPLTAAATAERPSALPLSWRAHRPNATIHHAVHTAGRASVPCGLRSTSCRAMGRSAKRGRCPCRGARG